MLELRTVGEWRAVVIKPDTLPVGAKASHKDSFLDRFQRLTGKQAGLRARSAGRQTVQAARPGQAAKVQVRQSPHEGFTPARKGRLPVRRVTVRPRPLRTGDSRRRSLQGDMLHAITHGNSTGRAPLLIAHGLFGSARNWGVVAKRLSATRRVTAVDMRNHGASDWSDSHGYPDMASDLADIIAERTDILGHSMGGKAAMALALTRPERLRRMVVADIAPVTYAHTQQSMIDAMRAVELDRVESRRDADAQLAERLDDAGVRAFLLQSLNVKERRWRLNLDVLEHEMSRIVGFPELDGVFEGPTLFLTGAKSTYVTNAHRSRIRVLFPKARFVRIPGAGHWLHADRPRAFEAAVTAFLDA